jgi:hypothetical protein
MHACASRASALLVHPARLGYYWVHPARTCGRERFHSSAPPYLDPLRTPCLDPL